jgi:hypothetical protein
MPSDSVQPGLELWDPHGLERKLMAEKTRDAEDRDYRHSDHEGGKHNAGRQDRGSHASSPTDVQAHSLQPFEPDNRNRAAYADEALAVRRLSSAGLIASTGVTTSGMEAVGSSVRRMTSARSPNTSLHGGDRGKDATQNDSSRDLASSDRPHLHVEGKMERRESHHKPLKGLQLFEWSTSMGSWTTSVDDAVSSHATGSHNQNMCASQRSELRWQITQQTSFGSASMVYEPIRETATGGRASVGNPIIKGSKRYNMLLAVGSGMHVTLNNPSMLSMDPSSELSPKDYTFSLKVSEEINASE